MIHGGISDEAWLAAVNATCSVVVEQEAAMMRAGPFYRDVHTGTLQQYDSRVVLSLKRGPATYVEVRRFSTPTRTLFTPPPQAESLRRTLAPGAEDTLPPPPEPQPRARAPDAPAKLSAVPSEPACPHCGRACAPQQGGAVSCTMCFNSWHAKCVGLSEEQARAAHESGVWQCTWCKLCSRCQQGDHEDKCVLCDVCDSATHIFCLTPPLAAVPSGAWRCEYCMLCRSCGARSSSRWWDDFCLCNRCHEAMEAGDTCAVCGMAHHDASAAALLCDSCNGWVHVNGRCEGAEPITAERWAQLAAGSGSFQCSRCVQRLPPLCVATGDLGADVDEWTVSKPLDVDVDSMLDTQLKGGGGGGGNRSRAPQESFCKECGKGFGSLAAMKRHVMSAHRKRRKRDEDDLEDPSSGDGSYKD